MFYKPSFIFQGSRVHDLGAPQPDRVARRLLDALLWQLSGLRHPSLRNPNGSKEVSLLDKGTAGRQINGTALLVQATQFGGTWLDTYTSLARPAHQIEENSTHHHHPPSTFDTIKPNSARKSIDWIATINLINPFYCCFY
jgi:hypothetical protein